MKIDKSVLKKLFVLAAGCILFAWLVLDTARATTMFRTVWGLFSPFVVGAGIAFVFNVPMRAIERQLADIRKAGFRRVLSIVLTILCLVLIIMFVFELLIPQIRLTVESLSQTIPVFVEGLAAKLVVMLQDHPEMRAWIQETLNLESLDWSSILTEALGFLSNQMSTVMGGAVTVIGSVTKAIINTVPDARKAAAVAAAVEGPVTNLCPASILQTHPDCHLYLDAPAASQLKGSYQE